MGLKMSDVYARQNGYKVEITDVSKDEFRDDRGNVHVSYYIKAVFNDDRLSSKLNGKNAFGHKWEKAIYALASPSGDAGIIRGCDEFLMKKSS